MEIQVRLLPTELGYSERVTARLRGKFGLLIFNLGLVSLRSQLTKPKLKLGPKLSAGQSIVQVPWILADCN